MVHQYKLNGYNIVLDTCSGSVHAVDEVAYDIIAMYEAHSAEEIVERILSTYGDRPDVTREEVLLCLEDVAALKEAGKLFSAEELEGADPVLFTFDHIERILATFKTRNDAGEILKQNVNLRSALRKLNEFKQSITV